MTVFGNRIFKEVNEVMRVDPKPVWLCVLIIEGTFVYVSAQRPDHVKTQESVPWTSQGERPEEKPTPPTL